MSSISTVQLVSQPLKRSNAELRCGEESSRLIIAKGKDSAAKVD
jgi:hypothetical protein